METPKQTRKTRSSGLGSPTFLSPSVTSNKVQKDEMAHLNNRMANYVEKVRSLEAENTTLKVQITTYEEKSSSQTTKLKQMYETELSEARRLLDDQSQDKAQLQLENASLKGKFDNARREAEELSVNNAALQQELKSVHASVGMKDNQIKALSKELEEYKSAYEKLSSKHAALQNDFDAAQKTFESETLLRVDFENKIQSLREDLQFKEKIHAQELEEARKISTVTISEDAFKAEYEQRLEKTICDLREQHEQEIENYKDDTEAAFNAKVEELQMSLEKTRQANVSSAEAVTGMKVKVEKLEQVVQKLQVENNTLTNRSQDLEGQLEMQREVRASAVTEITKERDEALETLANMEREYSELQEIKVKLDGEINVYRKLLQEEEKRLHLTPSPMPEGSKTRSRVRRKRKRVEMTTQQVTTTSTSASETAEEGTTAKRPREEVLFEAGPEDTNKCSIM